MPWLPGASAFSGPARPTRTRPLKVREMKDIIAWPRGCQLCQGLRLRVCHAWPQQRCSSWAASIGQQSPQARAQPGVKHLSCRKVKVLTGKPRGAERFFLPLSHPSHLCPAPSIRSNRLLVLELGLGCCYDLSRNLGLGRAVMGALRYGAAWHQGPPWAFGLHGRPCPIMGSLLPLLA